MRFKNRLRIERKKGYLSAKTLAKACGVSRSYITPYDTMVQFHPMGFESQLRTERKKNHLSAKTLAKACGVSRSYITLIENGKRLPSKKLLPKIARALNLKTNIVLNWYLESVREKMLKSLKI